MSISSLIREEVRELSLEGRDINIRSLARKYKCSPSLVVKNVYKVEKEENYKHITKFGVKGKVNLVIINFDEEREKDLSLNSHFDCLPHLTKNSHSECSPILTQKTPFESLPHLKENSPFDCSPHSKQNSHSKCLPHLKETSHSESPPHLKETPPFDCSPHLKETPPFDCSPHSKQNNHFDCSPILTQNSHLTQDPNSEYALFNVHQNLKEKEKVSYNLLKEKEHEKFINKFLSISQIDSLTSLNKYEKEILKTYIKYGGKLKESEIKFGKEILFYATPKQFEAILLKVIRDKKGETPRISYICEVVKRFNLKSRKKKVVPKLFEKVKTFNKSNVSEKNKSNVTEKSFDKELTSTFSYLGLTGEDALKAFFGESFKKENFVGVLNG